ncbi:TerC family protein [Azoarcus indigens]|uniref:Putative tellurium resistance membrane protein TerC n=1 Tax=Azoarcus indigens TaxID=29545 RepID=A0A4V3BKT4_9RHOO|nr:TerC family protein [Azoarcus indigens]TDN43522.1 putative tellurium resistance membrane protein TerC [Azoarcus indigens]
MIELLTDPAAWIGLATLVVLEIVLGIDNLIFIAILTEKLPPHQRDRARVIGLSLALLMRLGLLSVISWLVTLTTPLFTVLGFGLSGRDLILLLGGLFLLFKATTELHERLEGVEHSKTRSNGYASFSLVVAQIVVLDAVFSLDAVITAVGMVEHLPVMMAAVVISIGVMLLASRPLTRFVNAHPTVVVLCLSFLLMIGLSLVAEGLGFHLPKGYLYAAIGFSILIEFFNQLARRNMVRLEARRPLRERTAESVLRLLGGRMQREEQAPADEQGSVPAELPAFAVEERHMVSGVLSLAERKLRSIMTPRADVAWIDLDAPADEVKQQLLEAAHGMLPLCRGSLDEVVGVAWAKDLLGVLMRGGKLEEAASLRAPLYVPESTTVIKLIDIFRDTRGQLALVNDEYGLLKGVVTPMDVLEAIAGEFPDEDEELEIRENGPGQWIVSGSADLHQLELALETDGLLSEDESYTSLAGFLLARFDYLPKVSEVMPFQGYEFRVIDADEQRIKSVLVKRQAGENLTPA